MLNTLDNYIENSLPDSGEFRTNPNLCKKVDSDGKFLPFCGNTVVFQLDGETKHTLAGLQQRLYDLAGELLAERLDPAAFHITLHDLANGSPGEQGLEQRMAEAEAGARKLLAQWCGLPPLRMQATWLFNMVNSSIVLVLKPADEESWKQLDAMYTTLESVVELGYALTPHITLAYFRPGCYGQAELERLRRALTPVEMHVVLKMESLTLQAFRDMNHYTTI